MKKTHLFFISIVVLLFLNNCKKKSETTNEYIKHRKLKITTLNWIKEIENIF